MKCFRKIVSLLAMSAVFATLLMTGTNVMRVSAAKEPRTFYAKYDTEKSEWRIQIGEWKEDYLSREVYYLTNGNDAIVDGDVLVIVTNLQRTATKELVVPVRLSNLTFHNSAGVVKANSIDTCYVLGGSYAAVNGNVTDAYIYDRCTCSFNDNVGNMTITNMAHDYNEANISVAGTVDHVIECTPEKTLREFYSVNAGTLLYDADGKLKTDASQYSLTPLKGGKKVKPAQTGAAQPAATTASEGEYIVQKNDTMSKIARRNGLTLKELAALNPQIKNINLIHVGQVIKLK